MISSVSQAHNVIEVTAAMSELQYRQVPNWTELQLPVTTSYCDNNMSDTVATVQYEETSTTFWKVNPFFNKIWQENGQKQESFSL